MIFLLVKNLKSEMLGYGIILCLENLVMVFKWDNLFCFMFLVIFREYFVIRFYVWLNLSFDEFLF